MDSVREVDFENRRVRRVGGSAPPTVREGDGWNSFALIGDHLTFEQTGKPGALTPGSTLLIVWSTEANTYRGTLGSTVVAALDVNPASGPWSWDVSDDDRCTVSLTFDGDPVAATVKPEAGHLLSCLLNWASTLTDAQPFAGLWDSVPVDPDAGVLRSLTAHGHPVAVFYDTELAGTAAVSLNLLPDQVNTTMGAVAAVTDISGWGQPEPVWDIPDVDLCRQALTNAGLTTDDIDAIEATGEGRLREAARITSMLTEHLAWEDTGHWWRHPHQGLDGSTATLLHRFISGDDQDVLAASSSAPKITAEIASRER